jgi:hypothetical protein
MSRTIKHQVAKTKAKMPKMEKGTKNTMRVKLLKELEDETPSEFVRSF